MLFSKPYVSIILQMRSISISTFLKNLLQTVHMESQQKSQLNLL
jgi:hypothetical protein